MNSRNRQFGSIVTMATCMPLAAVTILGLIYLTHGWILVAYLMTIAGLVIIGLIVPFVELKMKRIER